MVLWRPIRPSRTIIKKKVIFIRGGWNAKVGSQETPGVTDKFGLGVQNEAGQRLTVVPREHTGHNKCHLPTTQEMAKVNTNIFRISELKWMGMGEFNSDDHYIYYHGQESLRRNVVALILNKNVWNAVFGCNLKNNRMISVHFQGKQFSTTIIKVYAKTTDVKEAEVEWIY